MLSSSSKLSAFVRFCWPSYGFNHSKSIFSSYGCWKSRDWCAVYVTLDVFSSSYFCLETSRFELWASLYCSVHSPCFIINSLFKNKIMQKFHSRPTPHLPRYCKSTAMQLYVIYSIYLINEFWSSWYRNSIVCWHQTEQKSKARE